MPMDEGAASGVRFTNSTTFPKAVAYSQRDPPKAQMKIDRFDFFHLSMAGVFDIGDGSQDACLVRVRAGGLTGWGECEAAPLPSIAALECPHVAQRL
jgi:hypothetical protein